MLYLSQKDDRWKNVKLGSCNVTIGSDGCKITVLGMLADITPDVVNKRFRSSGKYTDKCSVSDINVPFVMPELEIANRWPKMAEVKVPVGQHFVVALDTKHIVDPWTGAGGENNNGYKILNYRNITPKLNQGDSMASQEYEILKNDFNKLTNEVYQKGIRISDLEAWTKSVEKKLASLNIVVQPTPQFTENETSEIKGIVKSWKDFWTWVKNKLGIK